MQKRASVTRYDEVVAALTHPSLAHWIARDGGGSSFQAGMARWLDEMDPARRSKVRDSIARRLSPKAVETLRPRLRERAEAAVSTIAAGEPFDVEARCSRPIASQTCAELLGASGHATELVAALVEETCAHVPALIFGGCDLQELTAWNEAVKVLSLHDGGMLSEWRRELLTERSDFLAVFATMFAYATFENVQRFMTTCVAMLARNKAQWEALSLDNTRIPSAVEECLRCATPVGAVHLVAREATTIGDVVLAPGESLLADLASANRDPERFSRADEADFSRAPNRHLSFGTGALACIGAVAARSMAQELLRAIVATGYTAALRQPEFPLIELAPPSR